MMFTIPVFRGQRMFRHGEYLGVVKVSFEHGANTGLPVYYTNMGKRIPQEDVETRSVTNGQREWERKFSAQKSPVSYE